MVKEVAAESLGAPLLDLDLEPRPDVGFDTALSADEVGGCPNASNPPNGEPLCVPEVAASTLASCETGRGG